MFIAITTFNGKAFILDVPELPSPINEEQKEEGKEMSEPKLTLRNDIPTPPAPTLLSISSAQAINPPEPEFQEFADPFFIDPEAVPVEEEDPKAKKKVGKEKAKEEEVPEQPLTGPFYRLGVKRVDGAGGDASPLLRPHPVHCHLFFS